MYDIIAFIAVIGAIAAIVATFILRGFKKRTLANIFELVAIFFLITYSAQFAYLFGNIINLDFGEWAGLLFFVFTIALGIYKVVHFVRYR